MKKKIELQPGQIWQKKGTLDVRMIVEIDKIHKTEISYIRLFCPQEDIRICTRWLLPVEVIWRDSFLDWIRKKDVKLIGMYDREKKKARAGCQEKKG